MTIPYDLGPVPARVMNRLPRHGSPVVCPHCLDEGHVCEEHPEFPWEGIWGTVEGHAEHGGAGMPCPNCCSPIPEDGLHSITEAFVPDWKRGEIAAREGAA